jgi:hypothetical protein
MSCTKKEILRLHVAQLELEMRLQEQDTLQFRAINNRIDLLASIVVTFVEATQSEWSDSHGEVKEILSLLSKFKGMDKIRSFDSMVNQRHEQIEAMLQEYRSLIEAMSDDEQ